VAEARFVLALTETLPRLRHAIAVLLRRYYD
jgi:hypothetical protein